MEDAGARALACGGMSDLSGTGRVAFCVLGVRYQVTQHSGCPLPHRDPPVIELAVHNESYLLFFAHDLKSFLLLKVTPI